MWLWSALAAAGWCLVWCPIVDAATTRANGRGRRRSLSAGAACTETPLGRDSRGGAAPREPARVPRGAHMQSRRAAHYRDGATASKDARARARSSAGAVTIVIRRDDALHATRQWNGSGHAWF
jgi:hypothetical protein